jgi:hypothetical protein
LLERSKERYMRYAEAENERGMMRELMLQPFISHAFGLE